MALCRASWLTLSLLLLALPPSASRAADWVAGLDEHSGLPLLTRGGGTALTSSFEFWGSDWSWADLQPSFKVDAPGRYSLTGISKALDFDLKADIRKRDERTLTWQFGLDAHSAQSNVMGGGIVFRFDPALIDGEMGQPELLPGNSGWTWGKNAQGPRVEVRFDPPLARLYFEPGDKGQLRAFIYKDNIHPGHQAFKATYSVSGDIAMLGTTSERFGLADPARWPSDRVDWGTSPVDLSFLNAEEKPAGKHGFVQAVGEQLQFADKTPVRFWGTNLSAYTLFTTPDDAIKQQARRLSALGFNLVRLHHHDSPWVLPNIFGDGRSLRDTQRLSAESLKKLDWWIKCLKDEGIYVWLDLHVERQFTPQDDIYGFDELPKDDHGNAGLKGYAYVNLTIQQAMKRFAEAYLGHVNDYTGLAYKDDPAIAAVLLTNEDDITQHYGNALLPDKNVPKHNRLYMHEASAFAARHGLPRALTWRSWEPGPAKLFLNDLEQRFDVDLIRHLRGLGVKVPIVTTSTWGRNGLSALPALTSGDLIDAHSYGGVGQLERNPLTSDGMINWIGAAQVAGKPLSVSEWNADPFLTPDRHALPLYVAATARHQGWNALVQYAYSQETLDSRWMSPSNWHTYNDPAMLATLPAAALLYRRGDVRQASTTTVFAPTPNTLFGQVIDPANSVLLRTAMLKSRLQIAMPATPELPWLQASPYPADAQVVRDPNQALLDANASEASSDTGELKRSWRDGIFTVDTPLTQAASGWLGGKTLALGNLQLQVKTANASVAVQSLDGKPLEQSQALLISLGTRAVPKDDNGLPYRVEPLEGSFSIKAPPGLSLYLGGTPKQAEPLAAPYRDGRYTISLDGQKMSNWLFLKKASRVSGETPPSSTTQ
ncbi:cellulase family glycosylhydrolase [Pseudomonas citronellolis]|uniref:cellulase family glycosylhydrolase n=1 Tax=Pseudomonas citronellolis TaxID=53408 RepID=UPI0023E39B4F|nr:cellulase family glycosylhydrolase [Pseudomonas citronellolis]MDF3933408.1 cellulase family glycosylhydrolase [Pseudomonas citronellolis]